MTRLREDVRRLRFWRAIIGEFLGSLFLILIGCGSYTVTYPEHPITVKVALAFGITYMAILYCVRTVGDMHFNPSITVAMMVTRRISAISGLLYVVAQTLGSLIGAALVKGFTAPAYRQGGHRADLETGLKPTGETGEHLKPTMWWPGGCTAPAEFTTESEAFAVELFATFLFVFVSFAAYDKSKSDGITPAAPFVVGLTYSACILFAMPYSGGSMNTARSFGPAIVNDVWTAHWVYWFGPLVGGILGGGLYDMIFSTKASFDRIRACLLMFHPAPEPGSAEEAKKKKKKICTDLEEDVEKQKSAELQAASPSADPDRVEVEYSGEPSERHPGSESKPRIKFFRPKLACCTSTDKPEAETHDDDDDGDTPAAAADTTAQTDLDSSTQSPRQQ